MGDLTTQALTRAGRIGEPGQEPERQRQRPAKPRRETVRPRPPEAERPAEEVPDIPRRRFDGMA